MTSKEKIEYKDEYVQSANSLFHFMGEEKHLRDAIENCALKPRYCRENIEYMDLKNPTGNIVKEMVVLQKCFCDIPLHKLNERFPISIANENDLSGESIEKIQNGDYYTHTGCYGKYGIAFSKAWCIEHGLQPVIYVNSKSGYLSQLKDMFSHIMSQEETEDIYVGDLMRQFAYIKPLQGIMSRSIDGINVVFEKNFHDEKEWRFISADEQLKNNELDKISFRRAIIDNYVNISNNLEAPSYEKLWLKFAYRDVKYIIVPNKTSRESIIRFIMDMPEEKFESEMERLVFISKIQVLEDIRKDW
jgi:hypothetical protein